ncbi:MAG: hypothetical protein KatS3mg099_292 [Candidatus Parcubacteria bacterium]|nr:MAG: hypothetical protein KatS3mg099_292 [Candidatus Parcubacteria bacterium]
MDEAVVGWFIAFSGMFAAFTGTLAGFGTSAVLLPLLLLALPLSAALPVAAVAHLANDVLKIASAPRSIHWSFVAMSAPVSFVSALAAGWGLSQFTLTEKAEIAAPVLVASGVLLSVALSRHSLNANEEAQDARTKNAPPLLRVGALSALAGTLSAISGAGNILLAPLAMRWLPQATAFIATTGAISALTNLGRLQGYFLGGAQASSSIAPFVAWATAGVLAGFLLGRHWLQRQEQRSQPRASSLRACAFIGVVVIILIEISSAVLHLR